MEPEYAEWNRRRCRGTTEAPAARGVGKPTGLQAHQAGGPGVSLPNTVPRAWDAHFTLAGRCGDRRGHARRGLRLGDHPSAEHHTIRVQAADTRFLFGESDTYGHRRHVAVPIARGDHAPGPRIG